MYLKVTQLSLMYEVGKGIVYRLNTLWRKKIENLLFTDQLISCVPQPAEFSFIHTDEHAILVQGVKAAGSTIIEVFSFA